MQQNARTRWLIIRYTVSIIFKRIYTSQWTPRKKWKNRENIIRQNNSSAITRDGLHWVRKRTKTFDGWVHHSDPEKMERCERSPWGQIVLRMNTSRRRDHVYVYLYSLLNSSIVPPWMVFRNKSSSALCFTQCWVIIESTSWSSNFTVRHLASNSETWRICDEIIPTTLVSRTWRGNFIVHLRESHAIYNSFSGGQTSGWHETYELTIWWSAKFVHRLRFTRTIWTRNINKTKQLQYQ